nr:fatty acid desaturase [uncultured Methylophaga sp.]
MQVINDQQKRSISNFYGVDVKEKNLMVIDHIFNNVMVYAHFWLVANSYLPLWTFILGVALYIPRWMITLHEFQHCFSPKDINVITRLNLLTLTPIQLGYSEMRDIHMRHHAYTATPRDPEYYHIKGSPVSGFINVFFSPEISVYYWLRDKKIDSEFIFGVSVRLLVFTSLIYFFGWMSIWYFLPVRLAYGSCLFFFSYWLHREKGEFGTFKINYPRWFKVLLILLYGRTLYFSVSHHDIHHDYPRVAGSKLEKAREHYIPRRTT